MRGEGGTSTDHEEESQCFDVWKYHHHHPPSLPPSPPSPPSPQMWVRETPSCIVEIYDVVEHGRRLYRTLTCTTDNKWSVGVSVGDMFGSRIAVKSLAGYGAPMSVAYPRRSLAIYRTRASTRGRATVSRSGSSGGKEEVEEDEDEEEGGAAQKVRRVG